MRIDELEGLLDDLAAEGRRPKFIYTVPSFQNPSGVSMSAGATAAGWSSWPASASCSSSRTTPTGCCATRASRSTRCFKLEGGDYVLYLGTFSKILSPGIRLGWLCAPPPVMEKIVLGKQASDLCTSTLAQYFVREYFAEDRWREYIDTLRGIYRERRDAMLAALDRFFPAEASWSHPEGGLFCWVTLPEYIDTTDLLAKALRENVAFVPGAAAYADGRGRNSMRLNFSASQPAEIEEGIRRIGAVVAEQVELYGAITATHELPTSPGPGPDLPPPSSASPPGAADPAAGSVVPFRRGSGR